MKYFVVCLWFVLCAADGMSQTKAAKVWASASFNKSEVMVGEPLMVTITVYTSTWFTSPPEFDEIQVPQALMVRYAERTGSTTKRIGNKNYPAIQQKYLVYPTKVGKNALPPISIIVECPPEGDYKGRRRTIKSPERSFNVLAPPNDIQTDKWLAAYRVTLSERWTPDLDNLKTGDVLERHITIQASGSLAAMIPPIEQDEVEFGSIYQKQPTLANRQLSSSFSGTRKETWTYLLESEGDFEIPPIEYSWYSLRAKSLNSEVLESRNITIAPNPDMDFILSMQDSLNALMAAQEPGLTVAESFSFMGLNWWQLMVVVVLLAVLIFWLSRIIKKLLHYSKRRKELELQSEAHYFSLFREAVRNGTELEVWRQLMLWYDHFRDPAQSADFREFLNQAGDQQLESTVNKLETNLFSRNQQEVKVADLYSRMEVIRKKYVRDIKIENSENRLAELNPI